MTIRIQTKTGLLCGYKLALRQPGVPEMAFVVRGRYRLAPGAPLTLVRSDVISDEMIATTRKDSATAADELEETRLALGQESVSGDRYAEADEDQVGELLYPSDFADHKPRADLLLRGTCHPPRRTDIECDVTFRVGDWKKTLKVMGHRVWIDRGVGGKHTDSTPIGSIAVDYAHAYGGPGFANNPVGKGHVEALEGAPEDLYQPPRSERSAVMPSQQLANVLHADGRPHKDGVPAGFGPLSPGWKLRRGKLGKKYDQQWLDTRAPYFATDMDPTYFNAAPPDQQLPGYLRGDEEIAFENLHPGRSKVTARLPGLLVRVFVRDARANAREIPMKLDTLFADLEDGSLYLTWRGITKVEEEDLTDVEYALVVTEPLADARRPTSEHLAALEAFAADPVGLKEAFPAGFMEFADRAKKLENATDAELEAMLENAGGNSPPVAMTKNLFGPILPPGADKDLGKMDAPWAKGMAQEGADPATARAQLLDGLKRSTRGGVGDGGAAVAVGAPAPSASASAGAVGMRIPVRGGESVVFPIGNIIREQEKNLLAMKKKLPPEAGPEEGAKIDAALVKIRTHPQLLAADLHYRPYSETDPPPDQPGPGADLQGHDLSDLDLSGMDLSGADIQCAILSRTNLRGANLKGAKLGGARFEQADLTGADLTGVDLTSTSFERVSAKGTRFIGARLDMLRATKCDFEGASFARAEGQLGTFSTSSLARADFTGAKLELCSFEACDLQATRFAARLEHVRFDRCEGRGIILEKAELIGASFNECQLEGAAASGVRGDGAIWFRSSLRKAVFHRADLTAAHFHGVDALEAIFSHANLPDVRFDRAILRQANFERANLLNADLRKAVLTKTSFRRASLHDAKLTETAGADVDFAGADLKGLDLQRSKITFVGAGPR